MSKEMEKTFFRPKVITLFFVITVLFSGSSAQNSADLSAVQSALNTPDFTILYSLFSNETILTALNFTNGENKTFFAPTDAALASVPQSALQNFSLLISVLSYHIVPAYLPSSSIVSLLSVGENVTTVSTQLGFYYSLLIEQGTGGITVNNNTLNSTDLVQTGTTSVHSLNGVLLPPSSPNAGLVEVSIAATKLSDLGNFSTILSFLERSNVSAAINISDGNPKTLFAPTDKAFAAVSPSVLAQLNDDFISAILEYHIVPLYLPASSVLSTLEASEGPVSLPTLLGSQVVNASLNGSSVYVNDILVGGTNIVATGRTAIHSIEDVLLPPSLIQAVVVLAEIDSAISTLNASGYTTFASVLNNTDVLNGLNLTNGEPKTIFAPSNAAIAALNLSSSQLENVTFLVDVISYHIVPLYLNSTTILSTLNANENSTSLPTQLGSDYTLNVTQNATGIFLNSIQVTETDIVNNGYIVAHGISGVLTPPSTPSPSPSPPPSRPPPPPPGKATQISYIYAFVFSVFAVIVTGVTVF